MISTGQIVSTGLRADFSKFQERVNSSFSPLGTSLIRPTGESSGMALREVKVRECEIVRKVIDRLEMQIKQYTSVYLSRDQVEIALIKKCKTSDIPVLNSVMGNL